MVGSRPYIKHARRYRKMLGGAMRQVGILAAAGLHALQHNVERLAEDHDKARLLARGLARLPGIDVEPETVETNIVIFELAEGGPDVETFTAACQARGLLLAGAGGRRIRAVTHLDVSQSQCEAAIGIVDQVLA
jgi:threonine aldolase